MNRPASWLNRGYWFAIHSITLVVIGSVVAGVGARWSWVLELATHFRAQYFLALCAASLLYLCGRRLALATLSGLVAAGIGFTLLPFYVPADDTPPRSPSRTVRAISMNVMRFNADYQRALNYVKAAKPDLLLVIEVTPEWEQACESLKAEFASAHVYAWRSSMGMALFSQLPLDDVQLKSSSSLVPIIVARLQVDGRKMTFFGAHPPPPASERLAHVRSESLDMLQSFVVDETDAIMLMGDLNTTSWSPYFSDLLEVTKLRDTRRGRGIQPSWAPGYYGLPPAFLRIPIDHCLVSSQVFVHDRRLGQDIGSDHLPVEVEFSLENE